MPKLYSKFTLEDLIALDFSIENDALYGAVTFGCQWKFLQLIEKKVIIDYKIYYLNELPQLFGVLNYIVNV